MEQEIGVITHYFGKVSVGIIELKDSIKVGDKIHIKGPHDDFIQTVESMQIEHVSATQANKGDIIGLKVTQKVHPNDQVFKVA